MSNRRDLKKYVHTVCSDLAASIIETAYAFPTVDIKKIREIVNEIASLQVDTLAKVSVSFDKAPSTMEGSEYKKARRKYYRDAVNALIKEFNEKVGEILGKINAAIPEDVHEKLKAE